MKKIIIAGGGLVGSLLSIFLARRGFAVDVFEKRPDMRKAKTAAGKSINLVISDRGWKALNAVGIGEKIKTITVPVFGRMTHDISGEQNFLPYSVKNKAIFSVSRGELNARLMDAAEAYSNVSYHFNKQCIAVDPDKPEAIFVNTATGDKTSVKSDVIIGADGAFSTVREKMKSIKNFQSSEEYIEHGYKELLIPANDDGSPKMDPQALHIWPRKKFMLMALANLDGGFTCTFFLPMQGSPSFKSIQNEKDLLSFFKKYFPDAAPMMPSLVQNYFNNPAASLIIVRCLPWVYKNRVALIGDAAHAIVPFYGEGMNCGFEDCYVLDQLIDKHKENWEAILMAYEKTRKPNGDAIADLSLRNFIEMRDLVADHQFLLRKKIEAAIYKKHPDKWIPLYSQVKFSDIPYCQALKEGCRQDEIMQKILNMEDIETRWDSPEVEQRILELVAC